jgi:hypothetical protein
MTEHETLYAIANKMKNTLLPFLFIFLLIPGISTGAEMRTLEIEFSYTVPDDPVKHLVGYRLYKENEQVCQTENPGATTITCDLLTEDGTFDFTLTACFSDDTESTPSPTFQYTIGSTSTTPPDPVPDTLQAVITPTPSSGEVPLSISFSASGSTGNISSYHWDFGDGTTSTGSSADHTYSIPGTYSATLRVEDESDTASLAATTITALKNITPPGPPTAALSSSTAVGNAPLTITFGGTLVDDTEPADNELQLDIW